jgi:hypothetical protein
MKRALRCNSYKAWTLTLKEESRLTIFENRILKRIFGSKNGEGSTMSNFIVCTVQND